MAFGNRSLQLPFDQLFQTLLPDFVLAFTFFTALTYAVLGRRFGQQRPAIAMSSSIGLALAFGLVWWEQRNGRSIRDLGPLAIGFAVILLAMILFQAIRQTGGSWAGAGIAFGASILVAWVLGAKWPVPGEIIQSLAIVALLIGIVAFAIHHHGHGRHGPWLPANVAPELADIRHDMSDLQQDERVGDQIDQVLVGLRRHTDVFVQHPEDAPNILKQIRRILPAEGWLTERLAGLRERAHHFRKGHVNRIEELRDAIGRLPPRERKEAITELGARYHELQLDKRLERLDSAVAETERRIRALTKEAEQAVTRYDYAQVNELLQRAEKLQAHNEKLFRIIDRTEEKLARIAQGLARKLAGDGVK
jgi:hypothetical protein